MEIQRLRRRLAAELGSYYTDPHEAASLARRLLEEVTGRDYPTLILSDYKPTQKECAAVEGMTRRLLAHEPLQYILGRADFGEVTLKTDPGVLIPRPDTALLCDRLEELGLLDGVTRAADLGTGSGAIALLLAHRHPELSVTAVDVSPAALRLARANARELELEERVRVVAGDLLDPAFRLPEPSELVVSNPPYILERERPTLMPHVAEREPERALFVPDDDPLLFYRALLDHCPAPRYAVEINPLVADPLRELFEQQGYLSRFGEGLRGERRYLFATMMK